MLSHQQEGPDVGDLVQLHEEPQSLLMVTAVLAVYGKSLPLQKKTTQVSTALQGLEGIFSSYF